MNDNSPLQEVVQEARDWAKETTGMMKNKIFGDTFQLEDSLRAIVKKDRFGELQAIRFKMLRYGAYYELGAGRGYRGKKGGYWKYEAAEGVKSNRRFYKGKKVGVTRSTDPQAPHRMNTGKRPATPFFDSTLRVQIPKLADILAEAGAEVIVRAIGIQEKMIK